MSDWDKIKNKVSELNTKTILNPIDKKPLDNELVMCLFCNKINLKYRFEPYYEVPFVDYVTRMFNTIINDNIDDNFFTVASSDKLINTYINSIKNVLITKINIAFQNNPDLKKQYENKNINDIIKNVDVNLILVSAIDNLNIDKYKKLSEMLYNIDNKYLDYAKESIINSNKNMSLDKMLYGIDIPEQFVNTNNFNYINIILIILIIIIILIKCIH
jgi:hypothetical protein